MQPLHYRLYLEPNLPQFTFTGTAEIDMKLETSTKQIQLHAKELKIHQIMLFQQIKTVTCTFQLEPKREELNITLPESVEGFCTVRITFTGEINDQLMGWYRSRYEEGGQIKYIAVTQFEERDARRAFPCLDHPAAKATFDISFMIDQKLQAISNTAIESEMLFADGRKLVKFEQTPKMCTYLVFFGVGHFEFLEDKSKKPMIRVIAPPGKIQYGQFGLDMGRKSITFCEEFTGVPYPLSKCDHLAIGDFAFGAMENWGCITYRENLLLVYPGKTSKPQLVRLASVIAHETSHLWFGDLVSPADWKYLWLNESFGEYFTYAIPERYYPEWQMWSQFVAQQLIPGMERDSLKGTIPIELPSDSEVEICIDSSTAPIIYNKGAAVLRMLVGGFLGVENFKLGAKHYLTKYQYNIATSEQFWEALEEATHKPVKHFAHSWIKQPGYPYVAVKRTGQQLSLTQHRFYVPAKSDKSLWLIPVTIVCYIPNKKSVTIQVDLSTREQMVNLPENTIAIKVNPGFTGVYRVWYDPTLLEALAPIIAKPKEYDGGLTELDRFGIENDFYAFVRYGSVSITEYMDFLSHGFANESGLLPSIDILNNLRLLLLINEPLHQAVKDLGLPYCKYLFTKIGVIPQEKDSPLMAELRNTILWTSHLFGLTEATKAGEDLYRNYAQNKPVPPDILSAVIRIGITQDITRIDAIKTRIVDSSVPESERQTLLLALGAATDKKVLQSLCEFSLEKVARGNKYLVLNSVAANPLSWTFFWDWFCTNAQRIFDAVTANLFDRVLISAVSLTGINRQNEIRPFLADLVQKRASLKEISEMAQEYLEVNQKIAKGQ